MMCLCSLIKIALIRTPCRILQHLGILNTIHLNLTSVKKYSFKIFTLILTVLNQKKMNVLLKSFTLVEKEDEKSAFVAHYEDLEGLEQKSKIHVSNPLWEIWNKIEETLKKFLDVKSLALLSIAISKNIKNKYFLKLTYSKIENMLSVKCVSAQKEIFNDLFEQNLLWKEVSGLVRELNDAVADQFLKSVIS